MDDTVELSEWGSRLRRRWWIVALLAIAGAVLGGVAADRIAPIHRAQGTLLVGPINGTVTRSTTLRASEDLAVFYADLARRQVVLDPVVKKLGLKEDWQQLRNDVSAVIPDQNQRLVTITVSGDNARQTRQVAEAVVDGLVALSPTPSAQGDDTFVSAQASDLKASITRAEQQVQGIQTQLQKTTGASERAALARQLGERERLLNELRHTYVELMSVDPMSEAGGLRVLDEVAPTTSLDRADMIRQGALGGLIGFALGLLLVFVIPSRRKRDRAQPTTEAGRRSDGTDAQLAAARQATPVP